MRDEALAELVRQQAARRPDALAYLGDGEALTWAEYDRAADEMAGRLAGLGLPPGERVAVWLPDGPRLHVAYTACERAGLVIVGIPARAGEAERDHLLRRTGARFLLDRDASLPAVAGNAAAGRPLGPDDLWLLNSTSGTTGLPKCVEQVQRTWTYLADIAVPAARLGPDDVIMSVVPSPFGFGLWTAHVLPPLLGVRCVLRERFSASGTLRAVAGHRVTVLACVATQLRMMLASPVLAETDLSSLRIVYTGGEATPPERAREWERRTGSSVLQFYGSNEFGAFSCTSLDDDEAARLTTVGRVVPGVEYRLYDADGADITAGGGPGQAAGRGPGVIGGYWDDSAANAALYNRDGFQLLPDLVTVDAAGYVRIAGRTADLIIRGGKNISAAAVEAEVGAHPDVDLVAAIPVPDPVFGERVCAVVTMRQRRVPALTLAELLSFLAARGVGKENFPEYLAVVGEMPTSSGGKIAKQALKARLPALLGLPALVGPADRPIAPTTRP